MLFKEPNQQKHRQGIKLQTQHPISTKFKIENLYERSKNQEIQQINALIHVKQQLTHSNKNQTEENQHHSKISTKGANKSKEFKQNQHAKNSAGKLFFTEPIKDQVSKEVSNFEPSEQSFKKKVQKIPTLSSNNEKKQIDTNQKKSSESNIYKQIYENDVKYWEEYQESVGKMEGNNIDLKWPYYFKSKNSVQKEKEAD